MTGKCPERIHEMLIIVQDVRLKQQRILASLEIPVVTRTNTHGALRRRDYSMFTGNGAATATQDTPSTVTSSRSSYHMF